MLTFHVESDAYILRQNARKRPILEERRNDGIFLVTDCEKTSVHFDGGRTPVLYVTRGDGCTVVFDVIHAKITGKHYELVFQGGQVDVYFRVADTGALHSMPSVERVRLNLIGGKVPIFTLAVLEI